MQAEHIGCLNFAEVREFLRSVFGELDEGRFGDEFLDWKLIRPHPYYTGARGFLRRAKDGRPAAYGALIPLRFLTPRGVVPGGHVIDWAASRLVPGAGIRMYREIAAEAGGVAIGIGGSADTREILPRIGAAKRGSVYHYTHVVRPWTRARRGRRDWKSPLRLLRDLRWAVPPGKPGEEWKISAVTRFSERHQGLLPSVGAADEIILTERSPALLNYWLDCPGIGLRGYVVECAGHEEGYFLLATVGRAARVVDFWTPHNAAWQPLLRCALAQARAEESADEVTVMTSHPDAMRVLDGMGLRKSGPNTVFLLDPGQKVPEGLPIALTMTDYDGFYL